MADATDFEVTVVRSIDGQGRPSQKVRFKLVSTVQVVDGHLLLANGNTVHGVFAPGEWRAFYRDNQLAQFGAEA